MSAMSPRPGFYGKLPAVGDFVHRRLPETFVDPWHAAMQGLLHATGAGTATRARQAPVWRFVLMPGLAGTTAWAGVMRASVDRVGRGFPLVIAAPLPPGAAAGTTVTAALPACVHLPDWMGAAETVLHTIGAAPQQDGAWLDRACAAFAPHGHERAALPFAGAGIAGSSLWWTGMAGALPGAWMRLAGWPEGCHAPALLGHARVPDGCVVEELQ
ncbi:type VI secretion system-associated protein TagF [Xanthomonas campestris]|uniref:Type VI secretion system-associated protein TagF n=1 Tax=Xanthomonas campestris pv. papavericola TaxID=487881 RepID=A0AAJ2X6J8_XANCA|nr:type VI secretion system-associated protein TagF [Xanthomonas campestris]MEC3889754.1 type VI secretion system-associated protein TagF [Xanthomonas campestris pv. papavericola]